MRSFANTQDIYSLPCLQRDDTNIFLLLDGAVNKGTILSTIYQKESAPDFTPLFLGTIHEKDLRVGPQLVKVKPGSSLLQWFVDEAADSGIMLFSGSSTEALGKHLRPFIECILPDDRHKMFRFYDPMIFYYFWPSLTPGERARFMGPAIGAACAMPQCAPEGNDLLVSVNVQQVPYEPPAKETPWFVSEESYRALNAPAKYSLAKILAKDFSKTYPRLARILGRQRVLLFTQNIVERNETLGFSDKGDLKILMGYIAQLGIDFDKDPQYRRIASAFQNNNPPRQQLRDMASALKEYNELTWERYGKPYYMAFRRYLKFSYDDLCKITSIQEIVAHLGSVYPEKSQYMGDAALTQLAEMAAVKAREWGLLPRPGVALCAGILFFLGCGCENDPVRPWVGDYIKKNLPPQEKTRKTFEISQRIVRLNFKERVLEPEQQNALFVYDMLKPLENLHVATLPRPVPGSSLAEFLCLAHPEMKNGSGWQWAKSLTEHLEDGVGNRLPITVQALLVFGYMASDVAEVGFDPQLDLLQSYCGKNQHERAIYMLEAELHGMARAVTQDIYAQYGGDIL